MNSFLSYIGGKSKLAKTIIRLMPKHQCYVEVFCGAAWLYFKKPESEIEILNDINSDLVTLYRVVQNHLSAFAESLKWTLTSRAEYDRFKVMDPETMTDIQRSVRFYYLLRNTFASKLDASSFNVATTKRPRINIVDIEKDLSEVHLRLSETYIENKDYAYIINRYGAKENVFMYLDPPYFNCEEYYGKGIFERADFQRMADMLSEVPSKFIVSINDTPEIREIFKRFNIREVETTYHAGGADKKKKVTELCIMNYDPDTVELAYPDL